jgi:hypothetical protein
VAVEVVVVAVELAVELCSGDCEGPYGCSLIVRGWVWWCAVVCGEVCVWKCVVLGWW